MNNWLRPNMLYITSGRPSCSTYVRMYVCTYVYTCRLVSITDICAYIHIMYVMYVCIMYQHRDLFEMCFLLLCVPLQILEVPSKLFYSNSLVAKATFPPTGPQDIPPVGFVGVDGQEKRDEDSPSLQNLLEATKVAEKVCIWWCRLTSN